MAQFGRALRSGRRGRKFESCHLDQKSVDFVGGFFIQADRLGISSRDSVYIIAAFMRRISSRISVYTIADSCDSYHHTAGMHTCQIYAHINKPDSQLIGGESGFVDLILYVLNFLFYPVECENSEVIGIELSSLINGSFSF